MVSTDSTRPKTREDKSSRNWAIAQSTDSAINAPDPNPAPVPIHSELKNNELVKSQESILNNEQIRPLQNIQQKKPEEQEVELKWQYIDDHGKVEGPFEGSMMHNWFQNGFLPSTLKVKTTTDKEFFELSLLTTADANPFQCNLTAQQLAKDAFAKLQQKQQTKPQVPIPQDDFIETPTTDNSQANSGFNFDLRGSNSGVDSLSEWNSQTPKVWKVNQIESQWRSSSTQVASPPVNSPWGNQSQSSKPLLQDIQEQQINEDKKSLASTLKKSDSSHSNELPQDICKSQIPFSPWGIPSEDHSIISSTEIDIHDLFSSGGALNTESVSVNTLIF